MRIPESIERYRVKAGAFRSPNGEQGFGAFFIPGPCGRPLKVIASAGGPGVDWEHVSVSCRKSTPNWKEMCFIKDLFWDPEEIAMQIHPPKSDYVNQHEHCLHIWRPLAGEIPMPPKVAV